MANDLTSNLIGLSLLGGSSPVLADSGAAPVIQTKAARLAKAQFTLPVFTPPWKAPTGVPESVSAVQRLRSIIDQVQTSASLPPDLQTAFTAYKALDRLRVLAEFATRATTSAAERSQLQASFAKGVADLQRYLAVAPSDRLTLSFGAPKSRAETIGLPPVNPPTIAGAAVGSDRYAPLAGLTGTERLVVKLSRPGTEDQLTVDLSTAQQPLTLDRVAGAINAAIAAIPQRDANGAPVLDVNGDVRPRWDTKFAVVKGDKGWGLELQTMGVEQVSLGDAAATDGLMVAASQSAAGAPAGVALTRFDLPDSLFTRASLGGLSATDRQASAERQLLPQAKSPLDGKPMPAAPVAAAVSARAMVSDADGFSYVVGTSNGDQGTQRGDGRSDLLLSKVDSRGTVVWKRTLGSGGSAEGTALTLAPNGDIVVAGTVTGDLDGASTDGDMLVMRFSAAGEEKFATPVRAAGADRASAVSVAADGSIIVGGRAASGAATLARLDAGGAVTERRTLDPGSEVRGLATSADGSTLVLLGGVGGARLSRLGAALDQQQQVTLGAFDPTSLAIASDGRIAVGGNADGDGRVLQLGADLGVTATTTFATGADDRVDSLSWLDGALYAGGRTRGVLGSAKAGSVDGFVARLASDGAVGAIQQWGRSGTETGPVALAAAPGSNSAVSALGFRPGMLNPPDSTTLLDRTALRVGDRFSFRIDGGAVQTVTIGASDTLASLASRMARLTGRAVAVTTSHSGDNVLLRIEAKAGHSIDLSAGPDGHDALDKLGLDPGRLVAPPPFDAKAPRVTPGGNYGLDLTEGLSLRDAALAAASLTRLTTAIRTTQTAYRSLYWDSNKESLVNAGKGGGTISAYQSAQLGRYRDALARLGGILPSSNA